jgi:D-xylose transport system substrate-binding protein
MADIESAEAFTTPSGTEVTAVFLEPIPVTRENLNVVLDAGWITKDMLCQGVDAAQVAVCQ